MDATELDDAAQAALESLVGREAVQAASQDGTELECAVESWDGQRLRGLAPRLKLFGVRQLTLRWAQATQPWKALFELEEAEYHSDEQALIVLVLEAIELAGSGRVAPRVTVHAPGMLKATQCQNAVRGNEYTVRVDDVSETGVQFSTELAVTVRDEFQLTFEVAGHRMHLEARAMAVRPGLYGRGVVGAQIVAMGPGDARTLRELVERGGP